MLSGAGWGDGPWWRDDRSRNIGAVKGLAEGTKLVRVSAESYGNEFYSSRGGLEEAAKRAAEELSESNPVRSSDIFLAIQAISHPDQYGSIPTMGKEDSDDTPTEGAAKSTELITFAVYLYDTRTHHLLQHTVTTTPARMVRLARCQTCRAI